MLDARRYFKYHSKTTLIRFLSMLIISVTVTVMTVAEGCDRNDLTYVNSSIYILSVIVSLCASVLPIFEFAQFFNKRNLDTVFSLPIKRETLALIHFLNGYIHTVIIYTVCTVASTLIMLPYREFLQMEYILPYYFAILACATAIYCIITFIFLQANTVLDGIIFIGFWIMNLYLAADVVWRVIRDKLFERPYPSISYENLVMYEQIDNTTCHFQDIINSNDRITKITSVDFIYFAILAICGIFCLFGIFYTFNKRRAENTGEISDSIIGYKLNIPLYYVCLACLGGDFMLNVWLFIAALIGYFIYRRGFRLAKSDIITLGILFALAFILG